MDFELGDEIQMIQETVRKFSENVLTPNAAEADEKKIFPRAAWEKLSELGFGGLLTPEEYGGLGLGYEAMVVVMEELAKGCIATAGTYSVQLTTQYMILKYGNEEQKRQFLPRMASGEKIGALAITEPNAGSDMASIMSRAEFADDSYVINGTKIFITTAGEADLYLVLVKTDPKQKHSGISTLIVEKGTSGFQFGRISIRKN
jgi:acyl-CoA dehydrogenase